MKRRAFIAGLGGAAVWPTLGGSAQQGDQMRSIGVLMNLWANDAIARTRLRVFQEQLHQLGWIEAHNLRIHYRWTTSDDDELRRYASELVALAPEVIMATGSPTVAALREVSRTVPIVFVLVADPVDAGFVDSLARPGAMRPGSLRLSTPSGPNGCSC
jgi:putative tryptophan/tyrosine transport system substrate-binding protein